ncbi:MAG: ATP synthase F1 subunit gamma [Bacteroidetes bacterium]|jgi:F-type H+-transporting ATPase subunit gamma|nr:ATP synthase F1 subunit gamma [Bacteroidota bacterium]
MANLKEVRLRIASVNSTQQITKAMKMVSAAKLRRAQDAILQMRPYAAKLREILENLSQSLSSDGSPFTKNRPANNILIVSISSNRGLAGAFNSSIIKATSRLLNDTYSKQAKEGKVKVLAIGKKSSDFFAKNPSAFYGNENNLYNNLNFAHTAAIAERIMDEFAKEKWDRVILVYNQFKNAAVQILQTEQLLPIAPPANTEKSKTVSDYIFEPDKASIINDLLPTAVKTQLYKAVLDSHASEHGARMTAMNKATDNAGELIKDLRLQYNKARQAAITNEILEIVAGAEALKG